MPVELPVVSETALYTMNEACSMIPGRDGRPVTPQTLRNWIKDGLLTKREIGGSIFIEGSSLKRLLEGSR